VTATRPYPTRPRTTGVRLGIVYGFRTLEHPGRGRVMLGYVGQTVQAVGARERQHRDAQPWSDLIVGEALILAQGWWTPAELDAQEAGYIRALRPLYNYEYNGRNPHRIPIPVAREQRWARDDAAGRPRWQPGERTQLGGGRVPMTQSRKHLRVRWTRRRVRAALLAGSWLLLAVAATVWFARVVPLSSAAMAGMIAATAVLLVGWGGARSTGGRRRQR
jgi:hypothetical protein